MLIYNKIKQMREAFGYSTADIAAYLGINKSSVQLMESGDISIPFEIATKLSDLFGCDMNFEHSNGVAAPTVKDMPAIAYINRIARNVQEMDKRCEQ